MPLNSKEKFNHYLGTAFIIVGGILVCYFHPMVAVPVLLLFLGGLLIRK